MLSFKSFLKVVSLEKKVYKNPPSISFTWLWSALEFTTEVFGLLARLAMNACCSQRRLVFTKHNFQNRFQVGFYISSLLRVSDANEVILIITLTVFDRQEVFLKSVTFFRSSPRGGGGLRGAGRSTLAVLPRPESYARNQELRSRVFPRRGWAIIIDMSWLYTTVRNVYHETVELCECFLFTLIL